MIGSFAATPVVFSNNYDLINIISLLDVVGDTAQLEQNWR